MYWLRWHYRVKDIAGAPYRIRQKKTNKTTEAPTVSSRGQTTVILCSTSRSPSHCQTTTEKYSLQLATERNINMLLCLPLVNKADQWWWWIVDYTPTDSTEYGREMSTPPTLLWTMAILYLYMTLIKVTEKQQILMYKAQFTWQCYRLSYCEIIRKRLIHKDKINTLWDIVDLNIRYQNCDLGKRAVRLKSQARIFIARQHIDARYWYSNSVRLSVRHVPVLDGNGLTYCYNFFYCTVAQSF